MKVLVAGGAGFSGSHVVEALLDGGADVRVVDSLEPSVHGRWARTSPDGPGGADPGAGLDLDTGAQLIVGDLADPAVARQAVAGVDAVCHQAAKVGLGVDFGDVTGYVAGNDTATAVLLEALWCNRFAGRLVLASSMVVYGEGVARCPAHGPVAPAPRRAADLAAGCFEPGCPRHGCPERVAWAPVDESAPADPRNVYAATKLHQEHLCGPWGRAARATVVALRYHNVYGPRMPRDTPYAGVASLFRSALQRGEAPTVLEDGLQRRDFVHVRDVALANVLALETPAEGVEPVNVCSGEPHTAGDVASALSDAAGPHAPRPEVTGRWRLGDVRHIVASAQRAAAGLGFVAQVSFEDGMAEFARQHAPASLAT